MWGSERSYRSSFLSPHTSRWEPALDMPTPPAAAELKLGLDAHGDAVAVWSVLAHGEGEGGGVIEVSELRSGATRWTAPRRLFAEETTAHDGAEIQRRGEGPEIAVGPTGNAVLLWEQTTVTTLHEGRSGKQPTSTASRGPAEMTTGAHQSPHRSAACSQPARRSPWIGAATRWPRGKR